MTLSHAPPGNSDTGINPGAGSEIGRLSQVLSSNDYSVVWPAATLA